MEYQLKEITSEDVERTSRELLEQLKSDEKLREEARTLGVDLEKLDSCLREHTAAQLLEVSPTSASVDPATVIVLVKLGTAVAPLGAATTRGSNEYRSSLVPIIL